VVACTWTCRRAHAIAILIALWGVGLIAASVPASVQDPAFGCVRRRHARRVTT
jgi:hypothetical protein